MTQPLQETLVSPHEAHPRPPRPKNYAVNHGSPLRPDADAKPTPRKPILCSKAPCSLAVPTCADFQGCDYCTYPRSRPAPLQLRADAGTDEPTYTSPQVTAGCQAKVHPAPVVCRPEHVFAPANGLIYHADLHFRPASRPVRLHPNAGTWSTSHGLDGQQHVGEFAIPGIVSPWYALHAADDASARPCAW